MTAAPRKPLVQGEAEETFEPESGVTVEGAARLIHVRDILAVQDPPQYLIGGIVEESVLLIALGAAESCKSLWWQKAAACVATGTPMDGRKVKAGPVVYLCGEGRRGLQRRLRALEVELRLSLADAPLLVCFEAPSLCDPATAETVRQAIAAATAMYGRPELVIVDTFAQHMGGGDENRASDAGQFFGNIRRAAPESAIVVIHHTGWIESNRNRGSSAIKGGVDQELFFRKDGDLVTVEGGKLKDGDRGAPLRYRIKPVKTGLCREDGSPLDSVVLEPTDDLPPAPSTDSLGRNQQAALTALQALFRDEQRKVDAGEQPYPRTRIPLERWRQAAGLEGRRFTEVISGLTKREIVRVQGDEVSLSRGLQ